MDRESHTAWSHPIEAGDAGEEPLVAVAAVVVASISTDATPAVRWIPIRRGSLKVLSLTKRGFHQRKKMTLENDEISGSAVRQRWQ